MRAAVCTTGLKNENNSLLYCIDVCKIGIGIRRNLQSTALTAGFVALYYPAEVKRNIFLKDRPCSLSIVSTSLGASSIQKTKLGYYQMLRAQQVIFYADNDMHI